MLITGKVKAKGQGREDFRHGRIRAKYRVTQTGIFIHCKGFRNTTKHQDGVGTKG